MPSYTDMQKAASELSKEFFRIADDVDKHFWNCTIAKVAGRAAAIAGAGLVVVAATIARSNAGAAVPIAVVGVILSYAGTAAARGAHATGRIFSEINLKEAGSLLEKFKSAYPEVRNFETSLNSLVEESLKAIQNFQQDSAGMGSDTTRVVNMLKKGYSDLRAATMALPRVDDLLLSENIDSLVESSVELYTKGKSKAGDYLRLLAEKLQDFFRQEKRIAQQEVDSYDTLHNSLAVGSGFCRDDSSRNRVKNRHQSQRGTCIEFGYVTDSVFTFLSSGSVGDSPLDSRQTSMLQLLLKLQSRIKELEPEIAVRRRYTKMLPK